MNYSTLKKTVAFSFASLMVAGAVSAQTTAGSTTSGAKVFGGAGQYRTWILGVNAGITSPMLLTGGSSDFNGNKINFGYGVSLRKQITHVIGLEADFNGGWVAGDVKQHPSVADAGR